MTHKIGLNSYDNSERKLYEMMCRGEIQKNSKEVAELSCKYKYSKSYLKIAPFKIEEMNQDPYIIMFHDVMFDNEIEIIKQLAKPRVSKIIFLYSEYFRSLIIFNTFSYHY